MRRNLLIPSLEDLDTDVNVIPEDDDTELEEAMIAFMELDNEIDEEFEDIDKSDQLVDEVESSVERLEMIADLIRQYGVSAPMMKAADPYKELVAAGICCDYEELSENAVKDEESEELADKIEELAETTSQEVLAIVPTAGTALATTGGAVVGLSPVGWIVAAAVAIASISTLVYKLTQANKKSLISLKSSLSNIDSFDDEKFGGKTAKVLTKEEYSKSVKSIHSVISFASSNSLIKFADELANMFNGEVTSDKVNSIVKKSYSAFKSIANEEIKTILGISVEFNEGEVPTVKYGSGVSKGKGTLSERGWSAKDAATAADEAVKVIDDVDGLVKSTKTAASSIKKIANTIKSRIKAEQKDKTAAKNAIKQIKGFIEAYKTLNKAATKSVANITRTAYGVGKAAKSSVAK